MRRISVLAIGLVIIIVAAATIVIVYTTMSSARATTVRIEPESVGQLSVGDTFTVNVTVENCADIYAMQCDIRYDPEVLNAVNVSEGYFLRSAGITTFLSTPNQTLNTTSSLSDRRPTKRKQFEKWLNAFSVYRNGCETSQRKVRRIRR